VILCFS